MGLTVEAEIANETTSSDQDQYQMGVKSLMERGITRVPIKYTLPEEERPNYNFDINADSGHNLKLPVIDFAQLQGFNRSQVISSLAKACQDYGFFRVSLSLSQNKSFPCVLQNDIYFFFHIY